MQNEVRKEIIYPDSNRIGKFDILYDVLRDGFNRPLLNAMFGLCIILDVDDHESGRGKTYTAASELFQPLKEGEEVPKYRIEYAKEGVPFKDAEHEKRRMKNGEFGFVAIRQIIVRAPTLNIDLRAGLPKN